MKSLNDVLWNKDGEVEEEGKNNEYGPMGQALPPMLTDNCACSYSGGCTFNKSYGLPINCF